MAFECNLDTIIYDCLERIMDFLDVPSLVNLANTCKSLQTNAAAKFHHDHANKRIVLRWNQDFGIWGPWYKIVVENNEIIVYGSSYKLSVLRLFGANITRLCVETHGYTHMTFLLRYINHYCDDTLVELALYKTGGYYSPNVTFEKPFKKLEKLIIKGDSWRSMFRTTENFFPMLRQLELQKVYIVAGERMHTLESLEKLVIEDSELNGYFPHFVHWYPNLRCLEMNSAAYHIDYNTVSFPNLKHFGMSVLRAKLQYVSSLLNANRQLQSLELRMLDRQINDTKLAFLLGTIRELRALSEMKVTLKVITEVESSELLQFADDHPQMVKLSFQQYRFTSENVLAFIRRLNALERFEFCVGDESQCNRLRSQLDNEWQYEHRHAEDVYVITLNRANNGIQRLQN